MVSHINQTIVAPLPSLRAPPPQAALENAREPDAETLPISGLNPAASVTALQELDRQLPSANMVGIETLAGLAGLARQFGLALDQQLHNLNEAVGGSGL